MYRAFQTHRIRRSYEADAVWEFSSDCYNGKITVPSCWETIPSMSNYKGDGIYTKKLTFGGNFRMIFQGAGHSTTVYCDGKQVAEHYGAYTSFHADMCCDYGQHEIKIVCNNTYNENTALHKYNDYYAYGGMIRPLIMEELAAAVIEYIHFTPMKKDDAWWGRVEVKITNKSDTVRQERLELALEDAVFLKEEIELMPNAEEIIIRELPFHNVTAYSLNHPVLYLISAVLYENGEAVDDLMDRVGFRTVEIRGKEILFNGEKLKILGFNRHEDYNSFGSSIPLQGMLRDLALMKEAGANAVRTSHYPNDELFLDLCDELGILVWEEGHARGLKEEHMAREQFLAQSVACAEEMVMQHFNHPSIFCWAILNESVTYTEHAFHCYQTIFDAIAGIDGSRPLTSAAMYYEHDRTFELQDMISVNIYPLWYDEETPESKINRVKESVKKLGSGDKPFLISEIGAGGIYGYRNDTESKWTEERQAEILSKQLEAVLKDEEIAGVFLWQFCDCRVDEKDWFDKRPRTMNNKGIVDEYRRKKLAYQVVRKMFQKG